MPPESVSATIVSLALAMLTSLGVLKIASSLESGSSAGVQLAFDASQFALPPIQVIGAAAACSVKPMARVIAAISPSPLRDFEMPLYQGSMIFEMKFIPLTLWTSAFEVPKILAILLVIIRTFNISHPLVPSLKAIFQGHHQPVKAGVCLFK